MEAVNLCKTESFVSIFSEKLTFSQLPNSMTSTLSPQTTRLPNTSGIKIGQQKLYPKPTRPQLPPSKRGYLPNFPVAATEKDLEEAAREMEINITKIALRRYTRHHNIRR